jgi:hypothetical protein
MRVATYFCSIAFLLAACTTASSTSASPPATTSASASISTPATSTPTPTPSPEGVAVDVPDPSNLVAGYGSLWARSGSSLWEISRSGHVVSRFNNVFSDKASAVDPQNLAIGMGSVWTVQPRIVLRIDPTKERVVARVDTPRGCDQIAAGSEAMFLGCRDSRLFRIDPGSNQATLVTTVGVSPIGLAYGHGSIWWINASEAGGVSKIDPTSGSITTVAAPYAKFVVAPYQHIWFVDANGRAFTIDPSGSRASHAVRKARVALGVAYDHGTVLINDGDLVSFDAADGAVTQRAHVSGRQTQPVAGIAVLGSNIWLVDPKGEQIVATHS